MAAVWSRRKDTAADEVLIRALYEEHGGALLAYAIRLTGDRAAAEDIVQETLLRAWRHPEALTNSKGSVRGWLLTVARNIATDRFRARSRRPTEVAESPTTVPVRDDHADEVVDSIVVLDALEQLSPEHREVLHAIYFKGHTVAEAADALGVPPGTIKSRTYYALRRMREAFTSQPAQLHGQVVAMKGVAG
ncbi:sigma-70 family RNA polymerase sigma factor [Krasilnikovia sp. M28-CT-15]|uniref:sigma-70 family RNA polymerase sigma factor n=1 Tax=Krasilnikovia sp. M28-CT-15 TaxID=3373540 RepID=UPI0038777653